MIEDAACSMASVEPHLCQVFMAQLTIRSVVLDKVVNGQKEDPQL